MKSSFELKKERAALAEEARDLISKVESEKRDYTEAEQATQEERKAKIDKLTESIKERESLEGLQDLDERDLPQQHEKPEERNESPEDKEIRALGEALQEKRDFTAGMNSGAFRLNPIDKMVREGLKVLSQARSVARVTSMAGNETVPVDAGTVTAAMISEKGTYPDGGGSLTAVNFVAYKVGAMIKFSDEALKDVPANIVDNAILQFTKAVAKFENQYFITGSGSSQPQGILTGSTEGVEAAGAAALTADDIRGLITSLDTSLIPNARGWCAQATMTKLLALADKNKALNIDWDPTIGMWRVLGIPFFINSNMPAATTGLKPIVIGDPQYYEIKDRDGLEVKVLTERYADAGQVGYRFTTREDAHVMDSAAFKHLVMA
jgi:HK97 family phage major capsid protein